MNNSTSFKLELSDSERSDLRKNKVKKAAILNYTSDELEVLLNVSEVRALEIYALVDFQRIPSIGIELAKDLVFLGYHNIVELKEESGAVLTDQYEIKKGYKTDPCVEDQFRLVVDFAENEDYSKKWWDFTKVRKKFRDEFGYPKDRPEKYEG
jgi:hypothetical protein